MRNQNFFLKNRGKETIHNYCRNWFQQCVKKKITLGGIEKNKLVKLNWKI